MRFSSPFPLQLHFIDRNGAKRPAGSTIASRTPEIPDAETWLVQPVQHLEERDWDTLLGLITEFRIPGLHVNKQMTNVILERLSRIDHLTYLAFPGSMVDDVGLEHLERLPGLQHLDVSCFGITDKGLGVLRHLKELKSFKVVHHGSVSDAGVAHLASCKQLEFVDLMGTRAGDGALKALAGKLRLRHLVPGNETTDAGVALLHEMPMFKVWQGDTKSGSFANALGNPSAQPTHLFINLRAPITNQGLADLAALDGLFSLDLYGWTRSGPFDARNSAVTPAGVSQLAGLPHLGRLKCFEPLCTDEVARDISAIPSLQAFSGIGTDASFAAVSRSRSIEHVEGRNITGSAFSALAAMPALRNLGVNLANVDDESLGNLSRFGALKIIGPSGVPNAGYRHIGRCEGLESLTCMYCHGITDVAIEHVANLPNLKNFEDWGLQITNRGLQVLSQMDSLERVLIYDTKGVSDEGIASLARLPQLREVVLEFLPNVSAEAAAVFPPHVKVDIVTGEA